MNRPAPKTLRRRFFVALGHAIHVTWPVRYPTRAQPRSELRHSQTGWS